MATSNAWGAFSSPATPTLTSDVAMEAVGAGMAAHLHHDAPSPLQPPPPTEREARLEQQLMAASEQVQHAHSRSYQVEQQNRTLAELLEMHQAEQRRAIEERERSEREWEEKLRQAVARSSAAEGHVRSLAEKELHKREQEASRREADIRR
jgi:hypothetical protein